MNEVELELFFVLTRQKYRVSLSRDMTLLENIKLILPLIIEDEDDVLNYHQLLYYVNENDGKVLDENLPVRVLNLYEGMTIMVY